MKSHTIVLQIQSPQFHEKPSQDAAVTNTDDVTDTKHVHPQYVPRMRQSSWRTSIIRHTDDQDHSFDEGPSRTVNRNTAPHGVTKGDPNFERRTPSLNENQYWELFKESLGLPEPNLIKRRSRFVTLASIQWDLRQQARKRDVPDEKMVYSFWSLARNEWSFITITVSLIEADGREWMSGDNEEPQGYVK